MTYTCSMKELTQLALSHVERRGFVIGDEGHPVENVALEGSEDSVYAFQVVAVDAHSLTFSEMTRTPSRVAGHIFVFFGPGCEILAECLVAHLDDPRPELMDKIFKLSPLRGEYVDLVASKIRLLVWEQTCDDRPAEFRNVLDVGGPL